MVEKASIQRIVSGGQTGADRAALDFAIAHGIPYGGWCPKGRKAEDGVIAAGYALIETPRSDYLQRTEWNARDSDGTVVFTVTAKLSGGSKRTVEFASRHSKPVIHISEQADGDLAAAKLAAFVRSHGIKVLNVGGSRGSKEPRVARFVFESLAAAVCGQQG